MRTVPSRFRPPERPPDPSQLGPSAVYRHACGLRPSLQRFIAARGVRRVQPASLGCPNDKQSVGVPRDLDSISSGEPSPSGLQQGGYRDRYDTRREILRIEEEQRALRPTGEDLPISTA